MKTRALTRNDVDGFVCLAIGNRSALDMLYTTSMMTLHIRANISGTDGVRYIAGENRSTERPAKCDQRE